MIGTPSSVRDLASFKLVFPWMLLSGVFPSCILRAITGNVDIKGGDRFIGFNPSVRSASEIERHDLLSEKQKSKQLGSQEFPVFTYRGMEALGDATEKVWGIRYANLVNGCYMANPMAVFKAMADSDPYPVKAFFAMANNALMAYANTDGVRNGWEVLSQHPVRN